MNEGLHGGRGGGGGGGKKISNAQEPKLFCLATDNRRSRLDSPFCVITQHRKFDFGDHGQSKKISNAQELTMQLSQSLSSAITQIKVSNSPITNHTKTDLAPAPYSFFSISV